MVIRSGLSAGLTGRTSSSGQLSLSCLAVDNCFPLPCWPSTLLLCLSQNPTTMPGPRALHRSVLTRPRRASMRSHTPLRPSTPKCTIRAHTHSSNAYPPAAYGGSGHRAGGVEGTLHRWRLLLPLLGLGDSCPYCDGQDAYGLSWRRRWCSGTADGRTDCLGFCSCQLSFPFHRLTE
jgi:hypothetical protein